MGERRATGERWRVLTWTGAVIAASGIAAYIAGWRLGWTEMMVVAGGCLVALLVAVPFVVGRVALTLDRDVVPHRVMVGGDATATLTARAVGRRRSRRVRVDERVRGEVRSIDIPPVEPGGQHTERYPLPTDRRALVDVGPAEIARADPLGLMRRRISHAPADQLWVHPRWSLVDPLPSGFAKDLEGPTSDTSPAGDIAFHTLRPYQLGDDRRHIHWMSTARSGTLMVRHYVDNRRPMLGVHLDDDASMYDDEQFERAVEVVTSMMASMNAHQLPCVGRSGSRWLSGRLEPAGHDELLERLTVLQPAPAADGRPLVVELADLVRAEPQVSAVALVTGGRSSHELLPAIGRLRRRVRVIVVVIDGTVQPEEPVAALPGATVLRCADLDEFGASWRLLAR